MRKKRNTMRTVIGIILIILGAAFLLDKIGIISSNKLFENFWPIIIIVLGIIQLISKNRSVFMGITLILIGIFLLSRKVEFLQGVISNYFWPVSLIILGLVIVLNKN